MLLVIKILIVFKFEFVLETFKSETNKHLKNKVKEMDKSTLVRAVEE